MHSDLGASGCQFEHGPEMVREVDESVALLHMPGVRGISGSVARTGAVQVVDKCLRTIEECGVLSRKWVGSMPETVPDTNASCGHRRPGAAAGTKLRSFGIDRYCGHGAR